MRISSIIVLFAAASVLVSCGSNGRGRLPDRMPPPVEKLKQAERPPEPPRTVPTELGRVAGRDIGGAAATFVTSEDRSIIEKTTQRALERGQAGIPISWTNHASGNRGSITPQPSFEMDGQSCREFQQTIIAGGTTSTGYGTACRKGSGLWLIAENG